jgi:hypothetical protein
MSQTQDLESPRRYFYFAGLSVLSAIIKRNCFLDRGGAYKLYPNIYVMLVGPSGIKKGLPVSVAEKLVTAAKVTKVIAGRSSIQAIIENLGHQTMNKDGTIEKDATAFIVSGEFSQSILEDPQALTILTDLYDSQYKDEHTNLLKSGKSILRNVYLSMLGASNEAHLHAVIGQRDIMGGFIARTLMVSENRRNKKNSLVRRNETQINYDILGEHIRVVSQLRGEFQYTPEAADFYESWYEGYEPDNDDQTGTANRIPDTILKVAMLISLSRGVDMLLTIPDIQESIAVCMSCMSNAQLVTSNSPGATTTPQSRQTAIVLSALLQTENFRASRKDLVRKLWRHLDAFELTRVADTLKAAEVLREETLGDETYFILEDKVVAEYKRNQMKMVN